MKHLRPVELFLAVGLATAVGACGSPTPEAGEGGEASEEPTTDVAPEGGEGGASSGNPDVDYMTALALMKGHLMVAEELMEEGNYAEAEPHIGHPVNELYGDVEGQLSERDVPQFKDTLNELHDLSKSAPESPEMMSQYDEAVAAIDEAIAAIADDQRQSPEFVMPVIDGLLTTAAAEYEAAIADNTFVEVVEYQDSRGFVLYAEDLYETVANEMSQNSPEDHQAIMASFEDLKAAWPSVNPPEAPILEPSEVYSLVSEIELRS